MQEGDVELAAVDWLQPLLYLLRHRPKTGPGQPNAEH